MLKSTQYKSQSEGEMKLTSILLGIVKIINKYEKIGVIKLNSILEGNNEYTRTQQ